MASFYAYITVRKRGLPHHKSDTFLIYDSAILAVLERLSAIRGVTKILSNPSTNFYEYIEFLKEQRNLQD